MTIGYFDGRWCVTIVCVVSGGWGLCKCSVNSD